MEEKEKKQVESAKQKKGGAGHIVGNIIGIVLCVIFIPILIMNILLLFTSYTSDDVPSVGGKMPLIVLTESMYPEIQGGDMIICETCEPEDVQVGDVISFYDPASTSSTIVTHRAIEITTTEDGELAWVTKGDVNNVQDAKVCPASKLVGKYTGVRFAGLGSFAMWIQSPTGLIVCVVFPIILLVGYDVLRRKIFDKKSDAEREALEAELASLKREKTQKETNQVLPAEPAVDHIVEETVENHIENKNHIENTQVDVVDAMDEQVKQE